MPDQWGRPTFNDGMAIAQGLRSVTQDMRQQNVSEIAQKVAENPEWQPGENERYTPQALYEGRVQGIATHMDKLNLSEAQMRNKVAGYQLEREDFLNTWTKDVMPLLETSPNEGIEKAFQVFNDKLKNGITVKSLEGNKVEVTYPDGQKSVQQAPTSDQITQMAQAIMDPKAFISQKLAWDQHIKEINLQQALKAQDLRDPETGKAIGVKQANFFDKATNGTRPVYINSATGQELTEAEIKDLHKRGFISTEDLKNSIDLQKKSIDFQTAQAKLLGQLAKNQGQGEKEVSDIKTIERMIFDAGDNPSEAQVALINKAANKIGMEYKKVSEGSEGGWFGIGSEKPKYALVDKQAGQPAAAGENQGLASAGGAETKPNPQAEQTASVAKRNPGESIEDYLKRTRK